MDKIFSSEKVKNIIFNVIVTISIILFAIAISPKSLQNDTFYTIKIGEYISQNGISDLTQDTFSWHELPYTYPHWLYDLGMYFIYHLAGQERNLCFNHIVYSYFRWDDLFSK